MVPIRQYDRPEINVVGDVLGTMDYEGSDSTVGILARVVSMVPGSTIQFGLEGVCEDTARWDWTLRYSGHTVHPLALFLQESMPVQRRTFSCALNLVVDSDLDCVAPIGFD